MTLPRVLCFIAVLLPAVSSGLAEEKSETLHLQLKPVAAEASGLTHVINSDPKLGELKYAWMSSAVDIDADGDLDLLVYGHHGGGAAVWLGNGKGQFQLDDGPYTARWVFASRDPVWMSWIKHGVMDAIGTEGQDVSGRIFLNRGDGHWQASQLILPGRFQLADLDGDGQHDESFDSASGTAQKLNLELLSTTESTPPSLEVREMWNAEQLVGFPEGVERGAGPGRACFRDAYSVDLDGDDQNEIILHLKGSEGGFTTSVLYSWVLTNKQGAPDSWSDTTTQRGLPTGVGHWFYPEDINIDGSLDLVDLHTGQWYVNDGQGKFTLSESRVFDPAVRPRLRPGRPWTADNEHQWLDLDNNGYRDLVTASDHSANNGTFLNLGEGQFAETTDIPGGRRNRKFGDMNGDQRIDMITFQDNQLTLNSNQTPNAGISVQLHAASPARGHLGAKLWVYEAGKLGDATALVDYQQAFMNRDDNRSHNLSPIFHTGIADRKEVDIQVRFPSETDRKIRGVQAGQKIEVHELEP